MNSDRIEAVVSRLAGYARSPSLQHIRDSNNLLKLAREIVEAVDRTDVVWTKWTPAREEIVKAAANCWIPIDDLRSFLNGLPGPLLTATDVAERLRAVWEAPWSTYPNEYIRAGCLVLYTAEKALGTEMRAIIGALQEFVEVEEERLRQERDARWKQIREEDRLKLQERFRAGADCGWTALTDQRTSSAVATAGPFGSLRTRTGAGSYMKSTYWKTLATSWVGTQADEKPVPPCSRSPIGRSGADASAAEPAAVERVLSGP